MRFRYQAQRRSLQKGRGLASILRVIGKTVGSVARSAAPVIKKVGRATGAALKSKAGKRASREILNAALDVAGGKSVGKSSKKLRHDLVKIAKAAATSNNGKKQKKKSKPRGKGKKKKRKSTIFD